MPNPPATPPPPSKFRISPRAVIWLKRQLRMMLTAKGLTRSTAEYAILCALNTDPDVYEYFKHQEPQEDPSHPTPT